jgi:8-oxo-dGTP pyrophosphatase MutT (NUDIX family)
MAISRVRTSVVCIHNGKLLGFNAEDPTSGKPYVFLPGGGIEGHETAPEAAERETLEETGFKVAVDPMQSVDKEYRFSWDGEDYDVLTIFYFARLVSPLQRPVSDAPYHRGVTWVPMDEIRETFSYTPEILAAIEELITPATSIE